MFAADVGRFTRYEEDSVQGIFRPDLRLYALPIVAVVVMTDGGRSVLAAQSATEAELGTHRQVMMRRVLAAEEEQRRRIAADIHDDPLQAIASARLQLALLRRQLTDRDEAGELTAAIEAVESAGERLRRLLFELQSPALPQKGLVALLDATLAEFQTETGTAVACDNGLRGEAPVEVEAIIFQIVREALANARKHARSTTVEVRLDEVDDGVSLCITDDGVVFSRRTSAPSRAAQLSVRYMQERAELAGGWCRMQTSPGEGTLVEAWVPVDASRAAGNGYGSAGVAVPAGDAPTAS